MTPLVSSGATGVTISFMSTCHKTRRQDSYYSLSLAKIYAVCARKYARRICKATLTLSRSDRVAFKAPSGRPKGKQYRKFVIWFSRRTRSRSLISWNFSFSSWVTVPTPSGLHCKKTHLLIVLRKMGRSPVETCPLEFIYRGLDRRMGFNGSSQRLMLSTRST